MLRIASIFLSFGSRLCTGIPGNIAVGSPRTIITPVSDGLRTYPQTFSCSVVSELLARSISARGLFTHTLGLLLPSPSAMGEGLVQAPLFALVNFLMFSHRSRYFSFWISSGELLVLPGISLTVNSSSAHLTLFFVLSFGLESSPLESLLFLRERQLLFFAGSIIFFFFYRLCLFFID